MFGFGYLEIGILVLLFVLIFGARRAGRIMRRGFDAWHQVDTTRRELKESFSFTSLLRRNNSRKRH